ncbi:MAG: hypothetical protein Q8N39_04095 [Pelolinea sp.]|nr:hypothetical protein [Pelolinea sp.]
MAYLLTPYTIAQLATGVVSIITVFLCGSGAPRVEVGRFSFYL